MKNNTENRAYVFEENFFNGRLHYLWECFLEPGETGMRDTYIFLKAISQEDDASDDGFYYYDTESIARRTSLQECQVNNYTRVLREMGLIEIREDKPAKEDKGAVYSFKVNALTDDVAEEAYKKAEDIEFVDYS